MIIYYGKRLYGRTNRCGQTHMATMFVHIYFLPLIPIGSHLVLEEPGGGTIRSIPSGLNLRSTAAAYLRTWGVVAAAAALWGAFFTSFGHQYGEGPPIGAMVVSLGVAAAITGAVALSYARLGKLSLDERAQQLVYAEHAGYPVDVALLRDARPRLFEALSKKVSEKGQEFVSTGYRFEPHAAWSDIALDPSVTDRAFLGQSLTLARLDWSLAKKEKRAAAAAKHAAIWQKLRTTDPTVLDAAKIR